MATRIISKLDIKPPYAVKPVFFEGLNVIGDPTELAKNYYLQGIDEVYYIDIVSSLYQTPIDYKLISAIGSQLFIPFAVGGGVKTIDDFSALIHNGADKVAMNSYAFTNPGLITQSASIFGSQSVVVSIEAKRNSMGWTCYTDGGKVNRHTSVLEWAKEVENRGAGEIFLQSVDKDGFESGFDLELAKAVVDHVDIPVVVGSGAGSKQHIKDLILHAKPSGVAIASLLHNGTDLEEIKRYLSIEGIEVAR